MSTAFGSAADEDHWTSNATFKTNFVDPYGVPMGVVPRVSQFAKDNNNTRAALAELDRPRREDPIAQAVDDYLLMERKARAWDELRKIAGPVVGVTSVALDRIWAEVHPAQQRV